MEQARKCEGEGSCLTQTFPGYEKMYECEFECKPVECPNYIVCGTVNPRWVFDCHSGFCFNCNLSYKMGNWKGGKKIIKMDNKSECPICLDDKFCVNQPNCDHPLCIDCFKRCYYGDIQCEEEPPFPYSSEIEEQYFEEIPRDPKWEKDELIQKYEQELTDMDDRQREKYNKEENLRKCPICRR